MISIADYYKNNSKTFANSPSIEISEGINQQHFPREGLYIGQLEIDHNFVMPALIDLLSTNGISFLYKTTGERKCINHLIERLCWRLALTVPTRLCEFIVYGGDVMAINFSSIEKLPQVFFGERPHKIYHDTDKQDFTEILETLVNSIPQRLTQIKLADYDNDDLSLVRVNEKEGDDAKIKYQFLILADFPNHLTEEQSSLLTRIISQGTAAGIYVIMSWDMCQPYKSDDRNGFDFSKLLQTMTLIYPNPNGDYLIKNYYLEDKINKTFFSLDNQKLTKSDIKEWPQAIENHIKASKQVALDIRDICLTPNTIWKEDGAKGNICFPIGKKDSRTLQYMQLNTSTLAHAFIGGATGSGKSMLIHDIIINSAWLYSPEDLQFILLDFQGGAYDMYRNLPHTKLICHGGGRIFANKAMTYVIKEMQKRQSLIGEMQISEYNALHPDKKLPSIIVIIDEIQRTDTENTREAKTDLSNNLTAYVKEGRRVGMHLISATQAPSDSSFYMNNKDQIAIRIALKMKNDDMFIERSGTGYDKKPDLSQFDANNREALYNDDFGTYHNSNMFRYAFYGTNPLGVIKETMIPALIEKSKSIYGKSSPINYQCFYKEGWADVDSNPHWIKEKTEEYQLFVGCPHDITESHVSFSLKQRNGNNIISIGQATEAALSFSYHLHKQIDVQNTPKDQHYFLWINDQTSLNAYDASIMSSASNKLNVVEGLENAELTLMQILNELERRKFENDTNAGRIMLNIFDIERFNQCHNIICSILSEGAYYGIFTCLYAEEYNHFESIASNINNDSNSIDPLDAFSSGFSISTPNKKEDAKTLKKNFNIYVEFKNGEGYKLLDENAYESDIHHAYEANIKINNSNPIKFNLYKL